MKISLKWLCEYVDAKDFLQAPERLAEKLTSAGLEVEGYVNQAERFKNVVVGHIVELAKHPNADRLTVCQVDCGEAKLRQIVCGARNHKQGDRVIAALPGAVLPGDFAIKESKIRDVESKGMLCSESELAFKKESDGLLILPADAPVGQSFARYWGLDDVIFEINVTPNRADCLSHIGLAREVACLIGKPVSLPKMNLKSGGAFTRKSVQVELKAVDLCPRYAGRAIKGVKIGPSPKWLKDRLESLDFNSINNVVDVTNYVMLETGQPLHAFDVAQIGGQQITIEKAKTGETFVSLDGSELKLEGDELTIRDCARAVALAGIVGGKNSGVTDSTSDLFVESAHFTADGVRRAARKLGVQTDSAYRFSRGTDPDGVLRALERACQLIQEVAGGVVAEDHYDLYPEPFKRAPIYVTCAYVEQRLGYPVLAEAFENWMVRLGCGVEKGKSAEEFQVKPPIFRWDLNHKMDLVEEYARLNGYEHIPETFPKLETTPLAHDAQYLRENQLAEAVKAEGYSQAVNYGFYSSTFAKKFLGATEKWAALGVEVAGESVAIQNPLNEEMDVMRASLLPGLFKNMLHNCRHGSEMGRLFELGFVFRRANGEYAQSSRLALAAWGQKQGLWAKEQSRPTVFDLKGALENVLLRLGIAGAQWNKIDTVPDFLHPGQSAALFCEGRVVGYIGSLHPVLLEEHKIRVSAAVAEIDFEKLMRGQPRVAKAQGISKFPQVERDLALVLPDTLLASEVAKELKKAAGGVLQSIEVFDVFSGGNLPAGQRSVAFRMVLQDMAATLADEQLTALQAKMLEAVAKKFQIGVR